MQAIVISSDTSRSEETRPAISVAMSTTIAAALRLGTLAYFGQQGHNIGPLNRTRDDDLGSLSVGSRCGRFQQLELNNSVGRRSLFNHTDCVSGCLLNGGSGLRPDRLLP